MHVPIRDTHIPFGPFTALAAVAGLGAAACGASKPAPSPPPAPKTIGELAASAPRIVMEGEAIKRYRIAFDGDALPDPDPIERALARAGRPASVGAAGDLVEIEIEGVLCQLALGKRLPDAVVPDYRVGGALERHELPENEGKFLAVADATVDVTCRPDNAILSSLTPAGESVATILETLLPGVTFDPQVGRFWPRGALAQADGRSRFEIGRAVRVLGGDMRVGGATKRHWLATRGMVAFGRPDLAVFPIRAEDVEPMRAKMLVLADALLVDPASARDGATLEIGPARLLLWSRDAYAETLPPDAPGVTFDDPQLDGPSLGWLAIVDATATAGQTTGVDRLVGRLIR